MLRIGVDLGGTKIAAIAMDGNGAVRATSRLPTPAGDYDATLAAIVRIVATVEAAAGGAGRVGIATPGALSPATGVIKNANSTCLNGRAFAADIAALLARPVRIANDADCFALSEAADGAGRGAASVFGAILGTGVGGGIVFHGRLLGGANAIAGEWGHNPLPWPSRDEIPGPPCYCGRHGCIETFLSGPALARDYGAPGIAAERIAAGASAGEPAAREALARYADRLARGLASVINLIDPEIIVLGGGLSNIASLYDTVPARWRDYVFSDRIDTRLVPPRFGDASGVRGAARLWPPEN